MRILFSSCHETLEFLELSVLTELGHDVFSIQGAYHALGHPGLKRPSIPGLQYHQHLDEVSLTFPRTEIPESFFNSFDLIIVMHSPDIMVMNWPRMRSRKVIWRSIGQSTRGVEDTLNPLRNDGMKIVRMSEKEANIPHYMGHDAIIPFPVDPKEYRGWVGSDKRVINVTQTLKGRRLFCHYNEITEIMAGYDGAKVYGSGNEDLGPLNGGELTYDLLKGKLRDSRVFVYGGTWPSPYTLSLQDARCTGIPVVAIGKRLAQEVPGVEPINFSEIEDIIQNGVNGFYSDDVSTLRSHVQQLLSDDTLAKSISEKARETAVNLWAKEKVKDMWRNYLNSI